MKHPHPPYQPMVLRVIRAADRRIWRFRSWLRRAIVRRDVCLSCHGPWWPWVERHAFYHAECRHALDAAWARFTGRPVTCWECRPVTRWEGR